MSKKTTQELRTLLDEVRKNIKEMENVIPKSLFAAQLESLKEMEATLMDALGEKEPKGSNSPKNTINSTEGLSETEKEFLIISKKYEPLVRSRALNLEKAGKKVKKLRSKIIKLNDKMKSTTNSDELDRLRAEYHKVKAEFEEAINEYTAIEEGSEGEMIDNLLNQKIEQKNKEITDSRTVGKPFEDYEAKRKREIEEAAQYKANNDLRQSF